MNGLALKKIFYNYFIKLKDIKIFGFGIVHAFGFGLDMVVFVSFIHLGFDH